MIVAAALFFGLVAATPLPRDLNRGLGEPPVDVDRQTPLATVQGFLKAAHAGQYALAAHYLWLDHLPVADQAIQGAHLARHLRFVLDHETWVDLSKISKNPEGDPSRRDSDDLGVIPLRKIKVPIRVVRVHTPKDDVWVFDRETTRSIDSLYEQYGPPFGDRMPEWLTSRAYVDLELWQWIGLATLIVVALIFGPLAEWLLLAVARRMTRLTQLQWDDTMVDAGHGSLRLPLMAAVLAAGGPTLLLPPGAKGAVDLIARSLAIVALGWFIVRFINLGSAALRGRFEIARSNDPLRARGLETQVMVLRRVLVIGCYLLTGALVLLQFESVRSLGVSLLASAGVAGLALGFAAQKSLSTLFAGVQLSITQPVRMGDTVFLENEFGTVEEIRLTYVVVRLWDLRRMIVPISFFLEKPFQNWSKSGTDILGTVTLQVDYTAQIDAFRNELTRILEEDGRALWDGRFQSIQVTDASDRTQTLRVLVSAKDASTNWDLRCLIREQLIQFLRRNPQWMPVGRTMAITAVT